MKIFIALLALLPAVSLATEPKEKRNEQSQEQSQGQEQSQSQEQGNSQNASVLNESERQAPSIDAPAVYASHPCTVGWSAGLSVPGAGVSGGKVKADVGCERRELARVLTALNPALALRVLCADPLIKEVAHEGDCDYLAPTPPQPTASCQQECPRTSVLSEREELLLKKLTGKK